MLCGVDKLIIIQCLNGLILLNYIIYLYQKQNDQHMLIFYIYNNNI